MSMQRSPFELLYNSDLVHDASLLKECTTHHVHVAGVTGHLMGYTLELPGEGSAQASQDLCVEAFNSNNNNNGSLLFHVIVIM